MQTKISITQAFVFVALLALAVVCVVMEANGTLPGFLE